MTRNMEKFMEKQKTIAEKADNRKRGTKKMLDIKNNQ